MNLYVDLERAELERLLKRLEALRGGVEIGFPEEAEHYSGFSMVDLASLLTRGFTTYSRHSGAPVRAPARPFIRQLLAAERDRIITFVQAELRKYLAGSEYLDVREVWERVGVEVQAVMRDFALAGRITPGNTAAVTARKGFNKPWVQHGDLIGSIRRRVL
jgi:hypothetical protein